ncbi:MAG: hypothetical protein K2H20_04420 [Bacilli bacterium]|nr:hypothetical protein [Bacilli bacterium]
MAEENKSQSKGIGELFVEFGTKGVPGLLKNLNSVSASFLLSKNAASQFVGMVSKPIKEAGKGATEIGKLAAAFGSTLEEAARLKQFFKNYNLSEGLIGDLVGISDMLTKVRLGIGGISSEFAYAMHRMGLNWQDYDGSIESMIQMRNDVENAIKDWNPAEQRIMRQSVGLNNPEWSYAAEKGELKLDNYKSISEKEIQNLIKQEEAMAQAAASFDQLKMHLMEKLTPAVITIANWVDQKSGKGIGSTVSDIIKDNAGIIGVSAAVASHPVIGATVLGASNLAREQESLGGTTGHTVPQQFGAAPLDFGVAPWHKNKGSATGGASSITNANGYLGELPELAPPSALSSNSTNISPTIAINNTNNITGDNAQDIANKINAITMQNIDYAQYQVSNMVGV